MRQQHQAQPGFYLLFHRQPRGIVGRQLLEQALALFVGEFPLGFQAFDGRRNLVAADGKKSGGMAEKHKVVACRRCSAESANERDAEAAAHFFHAAQQKSADLARAADVRSSAGIEVVSGNFDEANVPFAFGQLAEMARSQQRLGLSPVKPCGR